MKKLYYIDIIVRNEHGELLTKTLATPYIGEIALTLENNAQSIADEAEKNGKEDGMLYEELFDSKEDLEIAMDNGLTADDMTNFN